MMIKILVLQQLYNPADDALEYQLLDRRSVLRFLDLTDSSIRDPQYPRASAFRANVQQASQPA